VAFREEVVEGIAALAGTNAVEDPFRGDPE